MRTLIPGTFTILSAYPDPPFDIMKDGSATGFDIERVERFKLGLVERLVARKPSTP